MTIKNKKIVILTGAGISAESGIKTYRDANGLWEEYNIADVASIYGWNNNQEIVLDFYNKRRKQLKDVKPNAAHYALAKLEEKYDVHIITQNVDDLHERAGSSNILHLHGELTKARSTKNENDIINIGYNDIEKGDKCSCGYQLRPHIVWFGENVPNMMLAASLVKTADIVMVIGTSMQVYPANGLINYASSNSEKYYIDPNAYNLPHTLNLRVVNKKAAEALPYIVGDLLCYKLP